jgi:adenine-specific DNA-methyltransferase
MIKYIGSKRALVPLIRDIAARLPVRTACDLFAGTTRVGQALRDLGMEVVSNDRATYAEALGIAYIEAMPSDHGRIADILRRLDALPGSRGHFTETFCVRSRYFQPHNGERIEAIRHEIDDLDLTREERGLAMTSLLEAADRVDSTVGLQMAYLKQWAPRAHNRLDLRVPHLVDGPRGTAVREDANTLARSLDVDLVYIDPPYNQHSYFSNYHVWETLTRGDAPEVYGVACKRVDCRVTKSEYNSKLRAGAALDDLLANLSPPWLIVSFNDEGYHDPWQVRTRLADHGFVASIEVDGKRYVGAQIGIHNPDGVRVGEVGRLRNRETVFIVGPDRRLVDDVAATAQAASSARSRSAPAARGRPR